MRRLFTLMLLLFIGTTVSQSFADDVQSDKQTNNSDQSNFYLFAASLDTDKDSGPNAQEEGILSNKQIRIINLGPIVNYEGLDYAPTVSADGRTLYYVSDRPGSKLTESDNNSHDFWAAKKNDRLDTIFFKPYNIDTSTTYGDVGVNTALNEGAASIAADRQTLFFTGCDRPDGLGDCDIYKTEIEGEIWNRPVNMGKNVNSKYWDSQPSISPYKTRIYFTSNRPGPNGDNNMDIWYSDFDEEMEEWLPAKNLEVINTEGVEVSPFIAADNVTLFFASDGHKPNYGKQDFYVTRYDPETDSWIKPENLGTPINTEMDEQFITLPASGDIIYFSSMREDLAGYQGSFDIFMAFVPTFFKAKILTVEVVDECSNLNIPAYISVKNPVTGRINYDTLDASHTRFEMIIANSDYGNPKDSVKFIDMQISGENPKYGDVMDIIRVNRPSTTQDQKEAGAVEDEINVTLRLGQKPVLSTIIEEADYVNRSKLDKPEIADFRGLVMEEIRTWDLYPLLNYVFFEEGSSDIPSRYIMFNSKAQTSYFSDTSIAGGTLDKYYHILNIYGFRLNQYPDVKIEVLGCNDDRSDLEKKPGLSKARAENVYNYLKDIWGISEDRMKLSFRDLPKTPSNTKDSLGTMENRRVEILCDEWEVRKPVFDKDPKTFPQPETMKFVMKNGIEDALVTDRRIEITRGDDKWKVLTDVGLTDKEVKWDWLNDDEDYPKDDVSYTAQLVVTTGSGNECKSDPITIPVMQVTTEQKKVNITSGDGGASKDSTLETYNLILFPFNSYDPGSLNNKIMNDYVYNRVLPSSLVKVTGHTDVVGLYEHNQRLSERRASSVETGIDKKTGKKYAVMYKVGVGEDNPLYDNGLPEGRFYNRTVQVIIRTPVEAWENAE